jgi:carboxypeptidase Q
MKNFTKLMMASALLAGSTAFAQTKNAVVDNIVKEETDNSQLEKLAHELFDGIGPRLVGSPGFDKAGKWALDKYKAGALPPARRSGANGAAGNAA